MKKIYIKDIINDKELLEQLLENNDTLGQVVFDRTYNMCMELQNEEFDNLFGNNWQKYINFREHYSSFYLILKDYEQFLDNLDKDYLCKIGLDLYDEILKETDEEIKESKSIALLKVCEEQLKEYENINNDNILEYFIEHIEDYSNLYYIENEDLTLYEDISYTKKWK